MPDFRQHDVTDCGPACLAYVFHRYGLGLSISSIRQKSGTSRSGTTALGMVETAKECGFEAKGLRCKFEDLSSLPLPGIAHVITPGGLLHYVVVCGIGKKSMKIMDPAIGRIEKWSIDRFQAIWTNVFIVLSPGSSFAPSSPKQSPWSRLVALLGPHKQVIYQALVGVVLGTILSLSSAVYVQKIIDNVILDGNRNLLRLLGVGMLCILVLRIVLGYFQSILILRCAQRIDAGLILGYYRHVMRLPQAFFDTMRVGEIISRVRDAQAIRDFLTGTVLELIINPMILIFAFAAMFAYSWQLALFSMALIPANVAVYIASDWLNRRYQREIMERSADFDAQVVESLHAMSIVRSCGMEEEMAFRTETRTVRLLKRVWMASKTGLIVGSAGGLLTQAYTIGLLWLGASLVLDSILTAGELMSCHALAGYITGPIVSLIGMNASLRAATTSTDRLYEILDLELEDDNGTADLELDGSPFAIEVDGVDFHYPGRVATLQGISLIFQSGQIVALAGRSGCGKSTILSLLQRHYLPDKGQILIDGVNIQYLKLERLRALIAHVPQRIDMLAGTVLENLAPGEARPDMPRIMELCRKVGILEFIESLPRGFHTHVSENGANLSGGQKQRVAVVRALYSDAPIVLMDEPSSALDSDSEDMLVETLSAMRVQGKLIILAVHNQRLLSLCDKKVELSDGRVVAVTYPKESNPDPTDEGLSFRGTLADTPSIVVPVRRHPSMGDEAFRLKMALRDQRAGGILFGQDHANVMGVEEQGKGWILQPGRCDLYATTDKWPALYGFILVSIKQGWSPMYDHVVPKIREAHERGGVILVSWVPENMATGKDCLSGCGVEDLLPGAPAHSALCESLDLIASKLGNLKDAEGRVIPILFRTLHQQNGDHFWWGRSRCTPSEYIRLFRFTVDYLREEKHVGNFLFVFGAGDYAEDFQSLLDRYPGDAWVDVFGMEGMLSDDSHKTRRMVRLLREVVRYSETRGLVPACTSIGFDNGQGGRGLDYCANPNWLREGIIAPVVQDPIARRIAFVCFGGNEGVEPFVHQLPFPESPHAGCMEQIAQDSRLVFGERVERLWTPCSEDSPLVNAEVPR